MAGAFLAGSEKYDNPVQPQAVPPVLYSSEQSCTVPHSPGQFLCSHPDNGAFEPAVWHFENFAQWKRSHRMIVPNRKYTDCKQSEITSNMINE